MIQLWFRIMHSGLRMSFGRVQIPNQLDKMQAKFFVIVYLALHVKLPNFSSETN